MYPINLFNRLFGFLSFSSSSSQVDGPERCLVQQPDRHGFNISRNGEWVQPHAEIDDYAHRALLATILASEEPIPTI
jgi:hypothetical protein